MHKAIPLEKGYKYCFLPCLYCQSCIWKHLAESGIDGPQTSWTETLIQIILKLTLKTAKQ